MKSPLAALCGFHFVGDALLLWLGYSWLSIPESNGMHLVWSVLVLVFFFSAVLWLHGTAFAYFKRLTPQTLGGSAKAALQHLPALFMLAVLSVILYWLVNWIDSLLGQPAFRLGSWLTLTLRRPVPPARVLACFHAAVWLVRWLLLPALLVPIAAGISTDGFASFRRFAGKPRIWRSLQIFVLLLGAVWVPMKLLAWVPKMPNFGAEMASFLLRAAVAYLLFAGLLLLLERFTSTGTPSFTQRTSSATP